MKKNINVLVYGRKRMEAFFGREELQSRVNRIRQNLPHAKIDFCDGASLLNGAEMESQYSRNGEEAVRCAVDLSFPFLDAAHIVDALTIFERTAAAYVLTHNPQGAAIPALIVLKGNCDPKGNRQDSFLLMLTEKESFRIEDAQGLARYREYQCRDHRYSTEKQLSEAIKYKDNLGDYYGKDVSHDPVLSRSSKDAPERIDVILSIDTGEICLDVGCSCGIVTAKLAEKGKIMTGVEIVPQLFDEAQTLKSTLPEKVRRNLFFINAPVECCAFEPASFDAIYMTEIFEHIPHFIHDDLFAKVLKYLKRDGCVVFSVPNRYPAARYIKEKRHRWDWFNHVTHYTAKNVEFFLGKYLEHLKFYPVYDEPYNEGIFLICKAWRKK